jgi:hypothetical protein
MKNPVYIHQIQLFRNYLQGYRRVLSLCLLLLVATLPLALERNNVTAQTATLTCRVDPSAVAVAGEAILHIEIQNVQDLIGYELQLTYEPGLINLMNIDLSQTEITLVLSDFLSTARVDLNEVDGVQGTIRLKVFQAEDQPGRDGSGELARIRVRGVIDGVADFTFTMAEFTNSAGDVIALPTTGCALQIGQEVTATPTPTGTPTFTPETPTVVADTPTPTETPTETPTPDVAAEQQSPIPTPTDTPTPEFIPQQPVSPLPTPIGIDTPTPTPFTFPPTPTPVTPIVVATPVDPLAGLEMFPGTPTRVVVEPLPSLDMFPDGPTKTPVPFEILSPPRLQDSAEFEADNQADDAARPLIERLALSAEQPPAERVALAAEPLSAVSLVQVEQITQPDNTMSESRLSMAQLGWLALLFAAIFGAVAWWARRIQV